MCRKKHAVRIFKIKMSGYIKQKKRKRAMEDRSRHSVVLGGWIGRPVNSVKVELECLSCRKKK